MTTDTASRPAAVLWDMDGTLVDTEPYWIETEHELVAEFGGHWDDEKAHSLVGLDLRDSAAILRDRGGVDLPIDDIVERLLDGVIMRVQRAVPWRPGARELLAGLRRAGIPTALVTMSWKRFADSVVSALPAGSFDVVITGDSVTNGKPHPEPYLAAAAALGVRPEHCVAIEDSPTGVRSAVAAGCRTIAVPNVVDIPESSDYAQVASLLHLDPAELGLAPERPRRRLGGRARVAVGAAVVAALGAGTVLALKLGDTPPPYPDMPINAWAPYWTAADAASTISRHGTVLHEVSPFWFEVKDAATIVPAGNATLGQLDSLIAAIRGSGGSVVPSVADSSGALSVNDMLATTEQRRLHVDALVSLATDRGFDGLDIDYESFGFSLPRTQWLTASENWVAFVRELGLALHGRGLTLTVTIPPIYDAGTSATSGYWVYKPHAIEPFVDHIRVMAYDFSTATAGPIAPMEWVRLVVKAMKKAVDDDDKLVLGVGMYGRNWVMSTTGTCPADADGTTTVTLGNVLELAAKRNATPVRDPVEQEASFTYDLPLTGCTQHRQVNFIDEQGVRARIDLARELRIGGVSLWALGFDSDSVWTGITEVARPRTKETTP